MIFYDTTSTLYTQQNLEKGAINKLKHKKQQQLHNLKLALKS